MRSAWAWVRRQRRPLGLCVAGGLLLSQLLTLYITPVLYTYLDRVGRRLDFGTRRRMVALRPEIRPLSLPSSR